MRRIIIVLIFLVGLPLSAFSQTGRALLLEWKFKEGEKFWVDTQTRIEQTERVGIQGAANLLRLRTITSYVVKKVSESNHVELEAKIESARYENNQTPDSEKMAMLYARLQGATFKLTLNPERQVQKLEGYNDWLSKLSAQIPASEVDRMRVLITETDLRNAASEGFGFLSDKPVTYNGQWKKKSELNLAPAGTLVCMLTYTYKGTDKNRQKISIECKESGKYTMTPGMTAPGTQSEFVLENRTGTIWFNNQTGKMEQAEHHYQTRGTIVVPATTTSAPATLLVLNKIQVTQYLTAKAPTK